MVCFGVFFFNHISGFFYIPLLLLLLSSSYFEKDTCTKNKIIRFSYLTLIGFLLSVIYGYIYSPHYFTYIYKFILEKLPNVNTIKYVLIIGSILLIPIFIIKDIKYKIIKHSQIFKSLIPHTTVLIIFIALYKLYTASFTSAYINKSPELIRWNMFNHGFKSIGFSSLIVYISYITPLGLIILLFHLYQSKKQKKYYLLFIEIILILFLFIRLVIGYTTPYQYYYARYLLAEIVPYSLLLISIFLGKLIKNNIHKIISIVLTLLISLNFLYHTSFQLQGQEADGSASALEKVSSYIDEQDLLIIDSTLNIPKIITPLKYYFNLNSLILDINESENHRLLNTLFGQYNDIFIISAKNSYNTNRLVDTIEYKEGTYEHSKYIPKKFSYESIITFFLYKLHPDDKIQLTNTIDPLNKQLLTNGFHKNSKWTNGNATISNISYYTNEKKYLVLETNYTNPDEIDIEKLNLEILINDSPVSLTKKENNLYYFSLDKNIEKISKIKINSSTFIPYEMNINPDTRKLGLYINSIKFL